MIQSNIELKRFNNSAIREDWSTSSGCDVNCPAGTNHNGRLFSLWSNCSKGVLPFHQSASDLETLQPNLESNVGCRKSPSNSRTRACECFARVSARLAEMMLFPSPFMLLVISNRFNGWRAAMCRSFVASTRTFSAARLCSSDTATNLDSAVEATENFGQSSSGFDSTGLC